MIVDLTSLFLNLVKIEFFKDTTEYIKKIVINPLFKGTRPKKNEKNILISVHMFYYSLSLIHDVNPEGTQAKERMTHILNFVKISI